MGLILISSIALLFFIIVLILIVVEKTFKAIILSLIVLIIFSIIFGISIISDLNDLQENFSEKEKLIILQNDDEFLTAIIKGDEIKYLTDDQLLTYTTYLKEEYYDMLNREFYRIIFFDIDVMEDIDDKILINNKILSKNDLVSIFVSTDPYFIILGNGLDKNDLFENPPNNVENDRIKLKAALLSIVYEEYVGKPEFLTAQFKKNNLGIYPQTAYFNFIKFLPTKTAIKLYQ